MSEKYDAQKKYLSGKKQLRVWMDADKYDQFKQAVERDGNSVYSVINKFIDNYLSQN